MLALKIILAGFTLWSVLLCAIKFSALRNYQVAEAIEDETGEYMLPPGLGVMGEVAEKASEFALAFFVTLLAGGLLYWLVAV